MVLKKQEDSISVGIYGPPKTEEYGMVMRSSGLGRLIFFFVIFCQLLVVDLAHAGVRHVFYRDEIGQPAADLHFLLDGLGDFLDYLLGIQSVLDLNYAHGHLTLVLAGILYAHDGAAYDALVFADGVLQLGGEDLVAVEHGDHSLDTALDEDVSVLVHDAYVTAVDPDLSVGVDPQDIGGLFRIVQVAQKNGWAGHTDLAVCVVW